MKTTIPPNECQTKHLPNFWAKRIDIESPTGFCGRLRHSLVGIAADGLLACRRRGSITTICAAVILTTLCMHSRAADTVKLDGREVRTDKVLVKWKVADQQARSARNFSSATEDTVLSKIEGVSAVNEFTALPGLGVIELATGDAARTAAFQKGAAEAEFEAVQRLKKQIAELEATGLFEYVEADGVLHALNAPNDAAFNDGTLWALRNTGQSGGVAGADIRATAAWDVTTGSSDVIVAVIDTGIRYTHQDLAANMWRNPGEIAGNGRDDDGNGYVDDVHGINAINNSGDPMDDNSHGSHCAGTIGAVANGSGPHVGVAWNVRLMALKFLAANGSGSTSAAVTCINYAVSKGAHILSNSWGGGGFSSALRDAITTANQRGILFVAAAGNSGTDNDVNPSYPANYDVANVVSVAATDRRNTLASFSNYGRDSVDLGAPGVEIYSCTAASNTSYDVFNGTSMATPHVAGVAALVKARFPTATASEIKSKILGTVTPLASLAGRTLTGGLLNADAAVRAAADGVLEINASPAALPLPAGESVLMRVSVTDMSPVLGASVNARFGSNSSVTLRDNGSSPDETANDGIYSANMPVPTGVSTVQLTVNATASGKQPATRTFDFAVASRPANDNFANRLVLTAGSVRTEGSNLNATRENAEPRQPSVSGDATVWWSWLAPSSGEVTISTAGSNFDTTLAVYSGDALGQLAPLGANDDSAGVTSSVTFTAQQGMRYAIQVSGYASGTGNIVLNYPSPAGAGAPVIVEEPAPVSVLVGSPFNIRVVATGATSYQWFKDSQAISGATNSVYDVAQSRLTDDGFYRVSASNGSGSATSREVRVAINPVVVNPSSDNFASRLLLSGSTGRTTADNSSATGEAGEPNHANVSSPLNSLWFAWQAPADGDLVIDTVGSNFDTTLAVYLGTAVSALTPVASNDDAEGRQSRVQFKVAAGTTYMIAVDGYSSRTGNIILNHSFTPSADGGTPNDNFADRSAMQPNQNYNSSNENATGESGEPNHHGVSAPLNSVWWQWTAPGNGAAEIATTGSDFDTTLAAYTGTALNSLTAVASNDDYDGVQSRIRFQVRAGERYMIAVDGYSSARGNVQLRMSFDPSFNYRQRPDFDGNGRADLLWQNSTTGQVAAWLRGQAGGFTGVYMGVASASWIMAGFGDFNNDGQADLLWRNRTTGQTAAWIMNGTRYVRSAVIANVSKDWEISAVGDFNGDGQSDILWRRTSDGLLAQWIMNGTAYQSARYVGQMRDPNWQIVGTGDFDGLGPCDDIVWHNRSNGTLAVWNMNGTSMVSGRYIGILSDLNWSVNGIADFNGDDRPDILWYNRVTGATAAWHMVNQQYAGSSYLTTAPAGWILRNK